MFSSLSESWKNTWESTSDVKVTWQWLVGQVCSRVYELLKMVKVFFFTVIRVFFTLLKVVSCQCQCTCYIVNFTTVKITKVVHHHIMHFFTFLVWDFLTQLRLAPSNDHHLSSYCKFVHTQSNIEQKYTLFHYLCWFPLHITYHNSMFNIFDLQELIPEFFYLPEMLLNENKVLFIKLLMFQANLVCKCQSICVEFLCVVEWMTFGLLSLEYCLLFMIL